MMPQKTISLTEEAYNNLLKAKRKKESFSQLIMRLVKNENPSDISKFAGIWKNDAEWDEIEKEIFERRSQAMPEGVSFD